MEEHIPSTGDHISVPGWLGSASVQGSTGFGLYRHHMLVTSPAIVEHKLGKTFYRVRVIHLNGKDIVEEETVLQHGKFRMHVYPSIFTSDVAVDNARAIKVRKELLGGEMYSLLFYNCESFVREAKTGLPRSMQVKRSMDATSGTVTGAIGFAPLGSVIGAIVGSVVPVVGTAIGAVTGGVLAGVAGVTVGVLIPVVDYARERILENKYQRVPQN